MTDETRDGMSADDIAWIALRAERAFQVMELTEVINSRKAIIGPRSESLEKNAQAARAALKRGERPPAHQMAALEQAIRLQRPAPCCVAEGLTPLPKSGNSLSAAWTAFQPRLKQIQASVCRLERVDDPSPKLGTGRISLGTGFLVADDVLVTAAHVVNVLSFGAQQLERGMAVADFRAYFGAGGRELREVVEVIAINSALDIALLRIDPIELNEEFRPALKPSDSGVNPGQAVCVVGYPLEDLRNSRALISIIFENHFGVKRAALGEVLELGEKRFSHDCSTLGGNSGSPVLDLNTGLVCGVHVAGAELARNDAVSGPSALNFITQFLKPSPSTPSIERSYTGSVTPREGAVTPNSIDAPKTQRSTPVKPHNGKKFASFLQQLQEMDAEISEDIAKARAEMVTAEAAGAGENEFQLETIVLTRGRPVLDIKSGATVVEISEVESEIWKKRLKDANSLILPNIPAVGRIELLNYPGSTQWIGTGWLIDDNVVVTNRHVANVFGEASGSLFVFRPGLDGGPMEAKIDFIEEFGSSESLEFPFFKILHIESGGGPDLAFLRIEPVKGQELPKPVTTSSTAVSEGDQVAVIGYPARDPNFPNPEEMDRIFNKRYDKKRLAPGLITGKTSDRIFHDCSTLGGNSGGEIISLKTGHAVALHFAGTLFARNHAVPIDVVKSRLDDVLRRSSRSGAEKSTAVTQDTTRDVTQSVTTAPSNPPRLAGSRIIETVIPIRVRVEIGEAVSSTSVDVVTSQTPSQNSQASAPAAADDDLIATVESKPEDYKDRKGYNPRFLGNGIVVPLPVLTKNTEDVVKFRVGGTEQFILNYQHFSVVMSKSRRMCRFSACNIDGKLSKKKKRTGWQYDPRIPKSFQIMNECYGNEPRFSRGHMTRREDPVWGSDLAATLGNSDSMHVTNTVPQMQPFNAGIWLGLEDYALDNAREDDMRICVFTGPFLAENDPFRYDVKIPVTFWKVIAFIHDKTGKLCATGYTMSQKSFLKEEEFVFSQHENSQRPISEIERRAGISFGPLADLDPLRTTSESTPTVLTSLNQIRFI